MQAPLVPGQLAMTSVPGGPELGFSVTGGSNVCASGEAATSAVPEAAWITLGGTSNPTMRATTKNRRSLTDTVSPLRYRCHNSITPGLVCSLRHSGEHQETCPLLRGC